jgi:uncharacterized protein YfkK (UPF0435 family)
MGFDQKGFLVFRVKQGRSGKWNVLKVGILKPLASFDTQKAATEYVHDLVSAKNGLKAEIFIERGLQTAEVDTTGSPRRE